MVWIRLDVVDLIEQAGRRLLAHARAATRAPWYPHPASSPHSVVDTDDSEVLTAGGGVPLGERIANPRYAALLHPAFGQVLGEWLVEAAARERTYREDEPNWNLPDDGDEAGVAARLAAALLRVDLADYGMADQDLEVHHTAAGGIQL